jgi:gluconolactonase
MIWTVVAALALAAQENKPISGIGPAGEVVKLHTGFKFTEGPAVDAEGNVYFSDIPNNRIHKVDLEGKLSTFLENSEGANGLMFDAKGRLVACQGGSGRMAAIEVADGKVVLLCEKQAEKGKPNDLVIDAAGGVWFTDPGEKSVYYLGADGKVAAVLKDLPRPNGVILSPDEKTLVVLPSGSPEVLAYPVSAPGKVGEGKVFCKLEQAAQGPPRGGDGLTVDTKGNFYFTQPSLSAIQVVSPEGKTLGLIRFPEGPSNCTFGGKDMKTLFVTARTSLYAVKMEATGHRFAAGGK